MEPAARQPVKVLYVIGTLNVGGAETQLVELACRLDRTRFEPVVCSLFSSGALAQPLLSGGVRLHALRFDTLPATRLRLLLAWPAAWRVLRQLWRVIREERPDVLHGVLFWAYVLGAFMGRAARVPVIVASRRSLGLFKADKPHYLVLERLANRVTDLIIANSEAVRQDTIARERADRNRIIVIRNGLDLCRFTAGARAPATPPGQEAAGPTVLVVANLIPYKGHEYFLHAWHRVVERFPAAEAWLAGDGVARDALDALARRLGIGHAVRFLGVRHDVPALLASADVFVHPSLQEGFSNAVLEAMAAGKPIVATAVGGSVEAIEDGVTGRLVPPADARALGDAIVGVLEDPEAARGLGERARRAAVERYEIRTMVQAYERTYADLLATRHRAGART